MKQLIALSVVLLTVPAGFVFAASKGNRALPDMPRFISHLADPVMPLAAPFIDPPEKENIRGEGLEEAARDGDRITAFMEPETGRDGGRSESFDLRTRVAGMAESADKAVSAIAARETTNEGATGGADAAFRALTGEKEASVAAVPTAGPASGEQLSALNSAIAEALAPINQKPDTKAEVVFTKLGTNDKRAVDVALRLRFSKKGPRGDFDLELKELVYSFPEGPGGVPETRAKLAVKVNLLNVVTQKQINELGPRADKFIAQYLEDYRRRYGEAAKLDIRVTHKDYEGAGESQNLSGLGLVFNFDIDLSKLPQGRDPKKELVTSLQAQAELTRHAIDASLRFLSNPNAGYFDRGQRGLKEALDALIKRDPKAVEEIRRMVQYLDEFAKRAT